MLCMLGAVGVQIIMFSIRVPAVMFFIIGVACQGFDLNAKIEQLYFTRPAQKLTSHPKIYY